MSAPVASRLSVPVEEYRQGEYTFGTWIRGRFLPIMHLGDDVLGDPATAVVAIGDGKVVYAEMREGSEEKKNWGGLVMIEHQHKTTKKPFYSLYGHITDIDVQEANLVTAGQTIGTIAAGHTPENGWWKLPHLHFSIYVGPWRHKVLPGWWRIWERRTWPWHWQDPKGFIDAYNLDNSA